MNYPQSQEILEEIRRAKKILVNCHRGPDMDSVGCALSLYYFLCSLGKEVRVVVSGKSKISPELQYFDKDNLIEKVDYAKLSFKNYDLLISPDTDNWQQVVDDEHIPVPDIPIVVIDHHETSDKFGKINLVMPEMSACCELVYGLFEDWEYEIDRPTANLLLLGIIGDTGGFQFSVDSKCLKTAADLIDKGGDFQEIIRKIFLNKKFEEMKLWGEFLSRLEKDEKYNFMWTALPYDVYKKYRNLPKALSGFSSMFMSQVAEMDFGIAMVEKDKKIMDVSFRSKGDVDVSRMAEELNGGGHKGAAGAQVTGLSMEESIKKVLETARKYAK
jgi:phosphoesterase RecJ-like protein